MGFNSGFKGLMTRSSNIKHQCKPTCYMRTDRRTDGGTDRHDETNIFLSQIFERA